MEITCDNFNNFTEADCAEFAVD